MQAIQRHYRDEDVRLARAAGPSRSIPNGRRARMPGADVVRALLSQDFRRSYHVDNVTGEDTTINSLFKTHIMDTDIQKQVDHSAYSTTTPAS